MRTGIAPPSHFGYRYAAVAAVILVSTLCVASDHRVLGLRDAIDETDRNTQLPLERFVIETGRSAAQPELPMTRAQVRSDSDRARRWGTLRATVNGTWRVHHASQ